MDCVMLALAWPNWALMLVTGDRRPVDHGHPHRPYGRQWPVRDVADLASCSAFGQ